MEKEDLKINKMMNSISDLFFNTKISKDEINNQKFYDYEDKDKKLSMSIRQTDPRAVQGWRRVILKDIIYVFQMSSTKQLKVLYYLLENFDSKNRVYIKTYKSLEQVLGISRQTISSSLKKLCEINIIKLIENETEKYYAINPKIISCYGSDKKQIELITTYDFSDDGKINKKMEIKD